MTASDTTEKVKKTKKTKKTRKTPTVLEEPVVMRVTRTVKKKYQDLAQELLPTSDQVNSSDPTDDTEVDENTIEIRRFVTEPARVNFHYTLKRSTHFQGIDVGCSVTIPCYREEVDAAMAEAKEKVAARLKIENRKTDGILDHLIDLRIKKDQELSQRGIR
jgi:hypothetical protein